MDDYKMGFIEGAESVRNLIKFKIKRYKSKNIKAALEGILKETNIWERGKNDKIQF